MIVVGLTGGIGSGKTTVANMFETIGVPVYIADIEAKKIMNTSKVIKRKLIHLFGDKAYEAGKLNRPYLANLIFNDKTLLEKMNAIVHPRVAKHFTKWTLKQKTPYVIKEAAILFENGGYKNCDFVVTVTAPKELRIERLLNREATTKEKIKAIMSNQWDDQKKVKLSNYIIENEDLEKTKQQVYAVHKSILKAIQI